MASVAIAAAGVSRPLAATVLAASTSSSPSAFTALHQYVSQAYHTSEHSRAAHLSTSTPPLTIPQALSLWMQAAIFPSPFHLTPDSSPKRASPPSTRSRPHLLEEEQSSAVASLSSSLLDFLPNFGILFAVPKNRPSKQSGKTRRTGFMLNRGIPLKHYKRCQNCGEHILINHICYNCFLNHKQLTRVTGWKNKSIFPWKDKVKGVAPAEDQREWTAPEGVPDNRAWIATQSEELYNKERAGETKKKKKFVSHMRREVLRFRERNEARLRHEDVNEQLWDDMREAEEERVKYKQSLKTFDETWAQKRAEKRVEVEQQLLLDQQAAREQEQQNQ